MSRIMDEMYETAKGLHGCGAIDKRRMLEYEAMYRASRRRVPKFTGQDVKKIRKRLSISQATLAIFINTSANTVRSWESDAKKPSGTSCLLLDIINRKGIEAVL